MPLYEYECQDCGERFTMLQGYSAGKSGYTCPECGGRQTRRVLSSFAVAASTKAECAYSQAGCDSNNR